MHPSAVARHLADASAQPDYKQMQTSIWKYALLLLGVLACHDSTSPSLLGHGPLSIVAGSDVTDTVGAKLSQALVVEVRDRSGVPQSNVVVRFTALTGTTSPSSWVQMAPLTSNYYTYFVADSTDSRGRAAAVVQMGTSVGQAKVLIEVPELNLQDTARYAVTPGAAAILTISVRDTMVLPGSQYSLSAAAADRFGNKRPNDPISFTSQSAVVSVDASGKVTALQEGRGAIVVKAGPATDTARVSVVPTGTLVMWSNGKLSTVSTDGSQFALLTTSSDYWVAPTWSPDGTKVAFYEGDPGGNARISTVDMSGTRALVLAPSGTLYAASYPRYSRDGNWIYFSGVSQADYGYSTYRVKPDGTQLEAIGPSSANGGSLRPDVSPDETTEVFQPNSGGIASMDFATHTIKQLAVNGVSPRYSPDGAQIAYLSSQSGTLQIWVMKADGTNQRQLTSSSTQYQDLSGVDWSPDGKWVVATTYSELDLVRVSDGLRLPSRVQAQQSAWKP